MITPPTLLILGNSHTEALRPAVDAATNIEMHWLRVGKSVHGTLDLHEAEEKIAGLAPDSRLVLMHLGAAHNIFGLLNHDLPFSVRPEDWGDDTALIPRAVMVAHMIETIGKDWLVRKLAAHAPCPVLHVMTPPPKKEIAMPGNPGKTYRGRSILETGFAPAPRRLALWEIENAVIADYVQGLGVTHVAPPPETRDAQGYLAVEFAAGDATHANAAYGVRLLMHLRAVMSRRHTAGMAQIRPSIRSALPGEPPL